MRKPVFIRKKVSKVHKKSGIYKHAGRLAAVTAAFCLLSSMVLTVYGEEKINNSTLSKEVVTNIYHKHVGSPEVQGGCYTVEIPHIHAGDEKNGGDCFQIPILHEHQGDSVSGGGCYGKEIPHVHQEGCYETHSHSDTCFQTIDCQEIYTQVEPYDTEERVCQNHGMTLFNLANSVVVHSDCGKEPENVPISYCQLCGQHQNTRHRVTKKLCAYEEGDIDYDNIKCGKNDGAVDGYERDCGYEEGEVESYGISCGKKTDGYGTGCNLTTDEPLGKLILTSKAMEDGKKAAVSARVEDLSFGKLMLSDEPFVWKDAKGNVIGTDDVVEVEENGNYSVTLRLENRDVEEAGLHSSILVDSIYKEEIKPTPQPSRTPEASPSPFAGTGGNDREDNEKGDEKDNNDDENDGGNGDDFEGDDSGSEEDGNDNDGNVIKEKTKDSKKKTEAFSDGVLDERSISNTGKGNDSSDKKSLSSTPSASPQNQEKMTKETAAVQIKEAKAPEETVTRMQHEEKKNSIFSSPAVRVITITAGALLLIVGILLLLAYLLRSVKVYNDDGEGKMCYLGRCLVHREEDVYFLTVSDAMVEKSYTNRYCIKPGLFRLGKEEDEELTVYKETKKAIVPLSREMIVMI